MRKRHKPCSKRCAALQSEFARGAGRSLNRNPFEFETKCGGRRTQLTALRRKLCAISGTMRRGTAMASLMWRASVKWPAT